MNKKKPLTKRSGFFLSCYWIFILLQTENQGNFSFCRTFDFNQT